MDVFEEAARKATSPNAEPHQRIAGLAVMAANSTSDEDYLFSSGVTTLDSSPKDKNFTCDTVIWIASVSKLMTAVAAMSCVERGLISLHEDVSYFLPELRECKILEGYDNQGEPVLRVPQNHISLSKLLSHSSGMGYDIMNPLLLQWQGGKPLAFKGSFEKGFQKLPLIYEPGESWQYSGSYDWVGKLVERLNGHCTLGEYLSRIMWGPLDMTSTTFHLEDHPDLSNRLATLSTRTESGGLTSMSDMYARPAESDSGGAGVFSTTSDILKLLKSLLRNDGKVLKPETTELLFTPQLEQCIVDTLENRLRAPATKLGVTVGLADEIPLNHGLAGLLVLSDTETGRKKNSMQWGGLPNLSWWIDPAGDRCGIYASQMLPKYDQPTIDLKLQFEKAIYHDWKS